MRISDEFVSACSVKFWMAGHQYASIEKYVDACELYRCGISTQNMLMHVNYAVVVFLRFEEHKS